MSWAETLAHARVHRMTSRMLVTEARALRSDALWIKVRARDARGARPLCGASDGDAGRIVGLIVGRALCSACIAIKADVLTSRVDDVLVRIGHTVSSHTAIGTCEACLKETVVHRIA